MSNYNLKRPCKHCPFRTDIDGYLRRDRAQEIVQSLVRGAEFPCHKTTEYVEDVDGEGDDMRATEDSEFCAGAMIAMMRQDNPNQIMRVAMRIGMLDPEQLDMSAPVGTLDDFIRHHSDDPEAEEDECCSVCDMGCLAPAGYMEGGIIISEIDREPVTPCTECGEPVCEECSVPMPPGRMCNYHEGEE